MNTSTSFQLRVEPWTFLIRRTNQLYPKRTVIVVVCSKLVVRTLADGIYVRVSMGTLVEASSIDLSCWKLYNWEALQQLINGRLQGRSYESGPRDYLRRRLGIIIPHTFSQLLSTFVAMAFAFWQTFQMNPILRNW